MKFRPRFTTWQAINFIFALLVSGVLLFSYLNPQQRFIPVQAVRMMMTLLIVSVILNSGEPVLQIIRTIFPARSRLELSARIGLGLSLFGAFVLVSTVFAMLIFDRFWVLIPFAGILYCGGLLLLRRKLLGFSGDWYRWRNIGLSLLMSLVGFICMQNPVVFQEPEWVRNLFIVYAIVIFPAAIALFMVREGPHRNSA